MLLKASFLNFKFTVNPLFLLSNILLCLDVFSDSQPCDSKTIQMTKSKAEFEIIDQLEIMQVILLTVLYALYRLTNNLLQETFPKLGSIIAFAMGNKNNKYYITI